MELKAQLSKPFTDKQKTDFIINCNHLQGFEIKETDVALEAWGNSEYEIFDKAKFNKYTENDNKAKSARVNQEFSFVINGTELFFDTTRETQQDLLTAKEFLTSGAEKYDWWDNKGTYFAFTDINQIIEVSNVFMQKANVYPIWAYYKSLIDKTTTIGELEGIDINYNITLGGNNDITN